jgi:predicted acetyltransferase
VTFELVWPDMTRLPGYTRALEQGWSPDNLRPQAALDELAQIQQDAVSFIKNHVDREGGGPITLPDGSIGRLLPSYRLWMWDGDFCGVIGFRWQHGTVDLPPQVLGHIGFSVVPWKRRRGYATRALSLLLPIAREEGLPYVELTTDPENSVSQRVIVANGGTLVERFRSPAVFGGEERLRFRILLA